MKNFTFSKVAKIISYLVQMASTQVSLPKADREDITNNLWVKALQIEKELIVNPELGDGTAYLTKALTHEVAREVERVLEQEPAVHQDSPNEEMVLNSKLDGEKFYKSLSPKEQEVLKNLYLGYTREEMAERFGKKTAQDFDYTVRSIKRKYLRFFREKNIFKT